MKNLQAFIIGLFTILIVGSATANAATWTVTKSTNSNDGACNADCSLREAVAAADSGDTVVFNSNLVGQTITLGGSDINITKRITIDGYLNNPNVAFISGSNTSRHFYVEEGAGLDLRNITLVQGNGKSEQGQVGTTDGGAIYVRPTATLLLTRVAIRGNSADLGGAISLGQGTHHFTNSSFTGNSGSGCSAIFNNVGTLYMANVTVSGNFTPDLINSGHAIWNNNGDVYIRNSTIVRNTAQAQGGEGGGIFNRLNGRLYLGNTIVAQNTDENGTDIKNENATITSVGGNLIGDLGNIPASTFNQPKDIFGVNPLLAPINANSDGFPVQVHPLQAGSPARNGGLNQNAVDPLTNSPLTTDARGAGFPRIVGGTVDIGAFEDQSGNTSLVVTKNTNSNDLVCDLDCSLREAVHQASLNFGTDTITFAPNVFGTLMLGGSEIVIQNQNVNIVGYTKANILTISGADTNRIFRLNNANVTLSGMTLANGNSLSNVASGFGGAVYAEGGSLMLDRVIVQNNSSVTNTGGIFLFNGANHRILNSTFSGNQTGGSCGGFNVVGGTMFIANTTISRNTANIGGGGFCTSANTVVRNSTITGNSVSSLNGAGGGIRPFGSGNLNLGNTIVAGNSAATQPELSPIDGATITSAGNNHIGDSAGDSNVAGVSYQASDTRDVPPLLGGLADNGGAVPTHALLPGSPAINTGDNAKAVDPFDNSPLLFDARGAGFERILDAIVDKGAFESSAPTAASVTVSGRVMSGKRGVSRARVYMTDQKGTTRTVLTNSFGYFRFDQVEAGETYIFNVISKSYTFMTQVVTVTEQIDEMIFKAETELESIQQAKVEEK
ncbi:MAG: carboxypeptidase-like regulatory domain-containing protein [Acidobacteria bacterium]|nr:carboxypeptidase-like regulatory domain-containing protein [Acidobacteriota bacterium]MCA1639038.1 carboxypeptidase-like regulatory domain-containing protein [Acidobacteriota bacterium]